jgi:hypothetical protein
MESIHFCLVIQTKGKKIRIQPFLKNGAAFDLCLMTLPRLELHLAVQVNLPSIQDTLIQIRIKSHDGHVDFEMVGEDLISILIFVSLSIQVKKHILTEGYDIIFMKN